MIHRSIYDLKIHDSNQLRAQYIDKYRMCLLVDIPPLKRLRDLSSHTTMH